MIIYLGRLLPAGSSSLPGSQRRRAASDLKEVLILLGLAPERGCLADRITTITGGLLHHLFTLTRLFSQVVIFCGPIHGLPRPGVTRFHALGSADFPHAAEAACDHPADPDADLILPVPIRMVNLQPFFTDFQYFGPEVNSLFPTHVNPHLIDQCYAWFDTGQNRNPTPWLR
jgi:hypothetical protein